MMMNISIVRRKLCDIYVEILKSNLYIADFYIDMWC